MAYQTKFDGNTDKTVTLGKEGNPTSIEGYFLGTKITPDTGYGPGKLHIFQTAEGAVGVWGKTRLDQLLSADLIGQMTLVSFTGMIAAAKKGKSPSYGFKVQHDKDNTIDTSSINLSSSDNQELDSNDSDVIEEEEPAPVAYTSPKIAAKTPNSDRVAKVQALLNGRK